MGLDPVVGVDGARLFEACSRLGSRLCSRDELCVRADARRAVLVRRGDEQGIHVPPGTLFVAIQREVVTGEPLTTRVTLH